MLTADSLSQIDLELKKYPESQKRSAVMSALRIAQSELGWLSQDTIKFVAGYLGLMPMAVYEVATFYNMYDLVPRGKYKLTVCTNLPCALSGGEDALDYLKRKLSISISEVTADGRFSLHEGECMGACGYAPVVLVNNHSMCRNMTPQAIDSMLAEFD